MKFLRTVALLIVYLVYVASANLYINRHNFARYSAPYEPRFPADITDPWVPCPDSNYFVHPRDCTWFYRCNDPIVKGYYHRYYFQCPFGTTFNSTIKICDLNHDDNCDGIPYEFILPSSTTASSASSTESTAPGASVVTSAPISVTSASSSSAPTTPTTTEAVDPGSEKCVFNSSCSLSKNSRPNCMFHTVCPSPYRYRISMWLCSTAYIVCPHCDEGKQMPACLNGEYFDPQDRTCNPAPTSDPMACSSSAQSPPCTFDGENPDLSSLTTKYCRRYKSCQDGTKIFRKPEKLCSRYVQCSHFPDNPPLLQWKVTFKFCSLRVAPLYSYKKKICVPNPEEQCEASLVGDVPL